MTKTKPAPLILPSNHPTSEICAPRADFTLLAHALGDVPLLYPPKSGSRAASDLRQAIVAYRRHRSVSVYISLSEKIGLPLSLLLRARRIQTPHVLIAHHLTSPKKRVLQRRLGWLNGFARIVVLSEPQADYLRDEAWYPESHIVLLPDSVDTEFWRPQGNLPSSKIDRFVLSVGQEHRDYPLLFAAAQTCPEVAFVVVGGSAWVKRHTLGENPPPNVTMRRDLSYANLRGLYASSALVVVPLEAGTKYAAGANGLLEAMAMGKPVILTETPGLRSYYQTRKAVHIIPAADPAALGKAICYFWDVPKGTASLCLNARRTAAEKHSLEAYAAVLSRTIREAEREG